MGFFGTMHGHYFYCILADHVFKSHVPKSICACMMANGFMYIIKWNANLTVLPYVFLPQENSRYVAKLFFLSLPISSIINTIQMVLIVLSSEYQCSVSPRKTILTIIVFQWYVCADFCWKVSIAWNVKFGWLPVFTLEVHLICRFSYFWWNILHNSE